MLTLRIISLTWLWNRRSVDRVSPRCLCDAAVGIVCPAKVSVGEGCRGIVAERLADSFRRTESNGPLSTVGFNYVKVTLEGLLNIINVSR